MIGQTVGHYRILEKLGAAGMGKVYRAEDIRLKRHVALKLLPSELAGSQKRLQRFQREAGVLAALSHPNIVTIYSVEDVDGIPFLTMELVEGKRLSELRKKGGMALKKIFQIGVPLADAECVEAADTIDLGPRPRQISREFGALRCPGSPWI